MMPTLDELAAHMEAELRDIFRARRMPLYQMMSYHLGWEDEEGTPQTSTSRERRHGVACLAACCAAGGAPETALPAAASVELVHNFSQIHDDVQERRPRRHNRDPVWRVWGPAQAINAGDGMHALARLAIFRLSGRGVSPAATFRALQLLDEAGLKVCEGRFQDIEAQERTDFEVDAYLEMAASKSAALFSCAMRLGALAASADSSVVDALGVCGAKVGMAVQIRDDLRELWDDRENGGLPGSAEALSKRKLLPVVYAMENATASERRWLGGTCVRRVPRARDALAVRQVLEDLGAREYCENLLRQYRTEAKSALDVPRISPDGAQTIDRFIGSVLIS